MKKNCISLLPLLACASITNIQMKDIAALEQQLARTMKVNLRKREGKRRLRHNQPSRSLPNHVPHSF